MYLGVDGSTPEISPTPTASKSATPTPTPISGDTVTILNTPTGFLRVREDASTGAVEVGRVTPGDTLPLIDEVSGWYKIQLTDGKEGWVSSQYASKETKD